jgi:hypothetical protein
MVMTDLRELEWQVAPAAPIDWCRMRRTIAAVARAEEARWTRSDGTKVRKVRESHPSRLPILTEYWSTVPGFAAPAAAALAARRSAANMVGWEWSAAFICFVMHRAGVRRAHGFEFGRRHMDYIVGALRNRERSDMNRPFWLVDHVELQREATPRSGDLLCLNRRVRLRPGEPPVMTRHSYSSLRAAFCLGGNQNRPPRGSSHCALVVGTAVGAGGRRFVETIGGNEGHSVRLRCIPVGSDGRIPNPRTHNIFAMIKLTRC